MRHTVRIHYDNKKEFVEPLMWVWVSDGATLEREITPSGQDDFGVYYDLNYNRSSFHFRFKDGQGVGAIWEDESLNRYYSQHLGPEIWSMADRHNLYPVRPAEPVGNVRAYYDEIKHLILKDNFYFPQTDVSGLGIPSMLGANLLADGSILFGFFHPRAARVYLTGTFNDFQCPGHSNPEPDKFIEMKLYRGFYYQPNIWLARIVPPEPGTRIEYKFYVQGGLGGGVTEKYVTDPYTRVFSDDFLHRNSVVVDPTRFSWTDSKWQTPPVQDLILYELNIYGFTDNDPDIPDEHQGTFKGVTHRIRHGYFNDLGVTVIALMPTAEVPQKRGLGYEPCTFMAVEKDFGTPDDFREMVNEAHNHGLAVIIDQVFNHTSNDFNPLWDLIDDQSGEGGFYFAGKTMWGNKVATGKDEVDNMLVDSCKLFIKEYHIDGFRFDATHSFFLNHKLLHRVAHEIKDTGFKPDAILIAENLPNEPDLNLEGYNGYAQWSNIFHDKIKALLREGRFEGADNSPANLGTAFYFGKDSFAAHTNNVINYCESHDENSVQFEVATGGPHLQDQQIKNRKARLGMLSTVVALGQPMIYMGQEYGVERERNRIDVDWLKHDETSQFYQWTKGLFHLRRRYPGLKLNGYNPADEGLFTWVIGPWLGDNRGGGHRVIGWRTHDQGDPWERILVLLNFEGKDMTVDLDLNPGRWIKLADIEQVNDIPPIGSKGLNDWDNLNTDGQFQNFVLPPYSGFIYKYEP
ncbi:MAG: alpha-amylase family glycosyl hydrolase [Bacillota bacterium]|jgi:1,4-alpha-glucan branching enzyme